MSLRDWIEICSTHDLSQFVPFEVAEQTVGWIRKARLPDLASFDQVFQIDIHRVMLHPRLDSPQVRTTRLQEVVEFLHKQAVIPRLYQEWYPVAGSLYDPPLLLLERAAVPFFGVRSYGIHLNGIVYHAGKCWMWIARRTQNTKSYPGLLDNMVAGGQSHEYTSWQTLIKEAEEEANIPLSLAQQSLAVSAITYCMETPQGLRQDTIFNYDLVLPASFEPQNTDGEVEEFLLWPIEKVMEVVGNTQEFKTNCNLVIIDYLIRQGWIQPESSEYLELVQGLHCHLPIT